MLPGHLGVGVADAPHTDRRDDRDTDLLDLGDRERPVRERELNTTRPAAMAAMNVLDRFQIGDSGRFLVMYTCPAPSATITTLSHALKPMGPAVTSGTTAATIAPMSRTRAFMQLLRSGRCRPHARKAVRTHRSVRVHNRLALRAGPLAADVALDRERARHVVQLLADVLADALELGKPQAQVVDSGSWRISRLGR